MKKFNSVELNDEEVSVIKAIIEDFETEDLAVRERQIREWKRYEFYWAGFTEIWWDSVAHDWRIGDSASEDENHSDEYYSKNINVFRAYLETIIAALSQSVPPIKCLPDDAKNVNDVQTAKGGSKIAELVYNHNDAPLLWIRALWIYALQGMVAAYNYTDEDESYGTVDVQEYENETVDGMQKICPNCSKVLGEEEIALSEEIANEESDEFDPGDDDVLMGNVLRKGKLFCPQCMVDIDPELKANQIVIKRLTGTTKQPKARQCIEVNGGLYVKIPNWARNQKDCPYLAYSFETHYSNIIAKYGDDIDEEDQDKIIDSSSDGGHLYERWGRLSPQYRGEYPLNTPTERHWWLRYSSFNTVKDEKLKKSLRKKFPSGSYVILVNDTFVKACNQNLDDHWTISFNPLSNNVHYDALGAVLTAIQDITTDLISLEIQTIEHSVPTTFASPKVVNFNQYGKTEVSPGSLYPAKAESGKSMGDGFFQLHTATVSPELNSFGNKVGELGQFVSGALPALYGGTQNASSRTASQYAMQGNRALQRLQITWKMINFWWKNVFAKVIPAYIKDMLEDERIVKPAGRENFIQVVIKKSQLEGKIGNIHLEGVEGLPQTVDQIKETLMNLLQTNNPAILQAIGNPANVPLIAALFGMNDFVVPGESDREKQLEEINDLLNSAPLDDVTPSVMPELFVDNHQIEAEVTREFLVGEEGRQAKVDNPDGYRNCLLHLQMHMEMMKQLMTPEAGNQVQPPAGNEKLNPVGA